MAQFDVNKAQQKIIAVLAHILEQPEKMVEASVRYQEALHSDPGAIRDFSIQVEKALGVTLSDSVLSTHPTVAGLATYCAQHISTPRGGRLYVLLCKMPDGTMCERIYSARGHEQAIKQAMNDGAADVLSVEREDADDRAPREYGSGSTVWVPLLLGILLGGAVFVYFWWKNGFAKFW